MTRAPVLRVTATVALAALSFGAPGAARAQSTDAATAEALFAAGREALERGDFETACAKLGESQRLDPAAGTLMNLAACNEQRGQLASAWENWREALATLRADDDRRPTAEARLAALEARLPRVEIVLEAAAPAGTRVKRDGQPLGPAALGVALPLDPGPHVLEASADGYETRRFDVTAVEGKTTRVSVAPGAPLTPPPPPPPKPAPPPPARGVARPVGWALAGTGAAALVAGGVTGALAIARKNDIESRCTPAGDRYLCDQAGVDAAHAGKAFALTSSILLPAGVALAAVGITLVLTAKDDGPALHAAVGAGTATLRLEGSL